ncbi:hypothetical protein GGI04_000357 [Coemansia thaxteri]|uniref:Uncharacterized protein n=1 Tax=Coemansia thaxteri TaxID=2663907 RepID=A0A9W8EHX6_9FUNG|nr:hypothetical protein H4R26_000383 [Coemansia thaxteri]KAJ2009558.1 hypothetical protein GGI04_000357 [Coemansia thaxteri]KAJ2474457.1 hypothetical protein GGI02_000079 [Coemansia sp. RSA 2322]KAJ2487703.1 hypothetical protein EV174_000374 [Coemansia sp. RSA 2320]
MAIGKGSRAQAEQDRQSAEKRLFLTVAGIGFTASLLVAVAVGHRRAHRAAKLAGESIESNHVNWAARAFGLGTLYAFGFVGCTTAAASYYMQSRGIGSMAEFAKTMRGQARDAMGGRSLQERLGISSRQDADALERADRLWNEDSPEAGDKKIRFARIKRLLAQDGADATLETPPETDSGNRRGLSVGARMRAALGFKPPKPKSKDDSDSASQ